jgi:methionyl aminopeptidase
VRPVPAATPRPPYLATGGQPMGRPQRPAVHDAATIERIRRACEVASAVLAVVEPAVRDGVTTEELDVIGHEAIVGHGAYPSPLGYLGYPRSICTAVNEVICHGIPDSRRLHEGDIVGIDISVYLDGVHGDLCKTVPVGVVADDSTRLLDAARRALNAGVASVAPGRPVNVIGRAIEAAMRGRFGIVREFVGHEIGVEFHGALAVPHHYEPRAQTALEPGMVFTIEPMIALGSGRARLLADGWTAVTRDGSRSAQFEHTVCVTADGCDVLTSW